MHPGKDSDRLSPRSHNNRPGRKVGLPRGAMLVLTRKSNQSIMIGNEIEVSVLAIMGEKVRIGIEAPRSIRTFTKQSHPSTEQDRSASDAASEGSPAPEIIQMCGQLPEEPGGEKRNMSASICNF